MIPGGCLFEGASLPGERGAQLKRHAGLKARWVRTPAGGGSTSVIRKVLAIGPRGVREQILDEAAAGGRAPDAGGRSESQVRGGHRHCPARDKIHVYETVVLECKRRQITAKRRILEHKPWNALRSKTRGGNRKKKTKNLITR